MSWLASAQKCRGRFSRFLFFCGLHGVATGKGSGMGGALQALNVALDLLQNLIKQK